MFRLRYTLFLLLVGLGGAAGAADEPKHDGDGAKAGHAEDHGKPPKYEVVGHGDDGKHFVKEFDLADAKQRTEFEHLVAHGHAHEITNKTAPTISKLASLSIDLGVWTLVIFGLLFFVLSRMAWPKMISGLQRREQNIRSALDEDEKARVESKTLMGELAKERAEAADKVKAIIDEAKRDAQTTADDLLTKARADITTERDRLKREIQIEVDQAMQSLWTRTASLATQVAGKAIRKQFDGDQQRRLIDEALDDIRKAKV